MAGRKTLTIVKPDAFGSGKAGLIIALLEKAGFVVRAARVLHLTQAQAGSSTPCTRSAVSPRTGRVHDQRSVHAARARERDDAVATLRTVIGATDPAEAAEGTVRKLYAESKGRNAIHASDSDENAEREARFFFAEADTIG